MPIRRRVIYATLSYDLQSKLDDRNRERQRQGLPPEKPPGRRLFVEELEGHALVTHPVFQVAPLSDVFRERIGKERDLLIKDIRLEREQDPVALILQPPQRFANAWTGLAIINRLEVSFTRRCGVPAFARSWIGMSRDRTWVCDMAPPGREKPDVPGLSLYVNILAGLDENGAPPRRAPQGPVPDDDVGPLEDLVP